MIVALILAALSVTPAYTNVNRAGGAKLMTNIVEWADAVESAIEAVPSGTARPLPRYLHALDFCDSYANDAAWYYAQPQDYGACSAVRDGGFLYRNYDWKFDETAEFVVRMTAGPGRFASIGVANCGTNLTEDVVTSGKASRYYKCLPGRVVDGINENGVVCEVNVVGGVPPLGTGGDIHPLTAVRWALDNGTSAAMVASNLAARIAFPSGWTQNFHWMIADAAETWIVENGTASNVAGRAIMTNFPIIERVDGMGLERWNLLNGGANITNAWFTRAYSRSTSWDSDFKDAAEMEAAKVAWETNEREELRGHGLWQTVHTSVYDITNRTLRVAVQEVNDWYTFAVPSAGGVKPEAVKEIVQPMIGDATNDLGKAKRDKTDLDVYQIGVVPEGPWTWTSSDERLAAALTRDGVVPTFGRFYGQDDVWAPVPDVGDDWSGDGPVFYVPSDEESVGMYFTRSWAPVEPPIIATATRHPVEKSVGKLSHVKKTGGALPSGLAKFGDGGELTAAKPSSEYGENADYRDPQDNICHRTEFGEWTFGGDVKAGSSYRIIENEGSPERPGEYFYYLTEDGTDVWSDGFYEKKQTDLEMPTYDGERTITATRSRTCTSNETFVTKSFVTNEVATAKKNAVTASSVTNIVNAKVSANLNTYVDKETGVEYAGDWYGGSMYYVPTGNVYPPNN